MLKSGKMERGVFEIVDTESLVPANHLLRKIDAAVDFGKIYDMVEPLYCADNGRPSVDPVVLFKMVLIQHLYGLTSLRRTAEEVSLNVAYRWFLGYRLQEETPHFSTISYNFRHRFTAETVDRIFSWILMEMVEAGYVAPGVVFVDGTQAASASKLTTLRARKTNSAQRNRIPLGADIGCGPAAVSPWPSGIRCRAAGKGARPPQWPGSGPWGD